MADPEQALTEAIARTIHEMECSPRRHDGLVMTVHEHSARAAYAAMVEHIDEQAIRDAVEANWPPIESAWVQAWHPEDIAIYRRDGWKSFEARAEAIEAARKARMVNAILDAVKP